MKELFTDFEYQTGHITSLWSGHDTARRTMPVFLCTCPINAEIEARFDDRPPVRVADPEVLVLPDSLPHGIILLSGEQPVSLWCHFFPTAHRSISLRHFFDFPMVYSGERALAIRRNVTELVTMDPGEDIHNAIEHRFLGFKLVSLLLETARPRPEAGRRSAGVTRLEPALKLLRADFRKRVATAELAAAVKVSPSRFLTLFREAVGMSPGSYREQLRFQAACELLTRGNRTLDAIAEKLGFCDAFHFSRRFTALAGISPGSYRRQRM